MENVILIVAYRMHYFRNAWNQFDFALIIVSSLTLLYEYYNSVDPQSSLSVMRSCQLAQIISKMKKLKSLR